MRLDSIFHTCDAPFAFAVSLHEWKVRIRCAKGDAQRVSVVHADRYADPGRETPIRLEQVLSTGLHDYYEGIIPTPTRRIRYSFLLENSQGERVWYGENGASVERKHTNVFHCPIITPSQVHHLPEWAASAVVYQIFPERFHNGDPMNDPEEALNWTDESCPAWDSFWGGDLQGVLEKLPYLQDLGITCVYLTPIFLSPTNHKYDTVDYYTIDPHFGDEALFRRLVEEAHRLGIRVMLDAVFNHSSDRFFAFQDVLKNGEASTYKDWFYIHEYPVVQEPVACYETFASNLPFMPRLNLEHPEVQQYMLQVTAYWMDQAQIDGWRLDVANEVPPSFWRMFRQLVKSKNPEALIIGEVMHDALPWLRGDQFDGTMNYPLRDVLLEFFARQTIGAAAFVEQISNLYIRGTDSSALAMLNLLDSHDTERFLTSCRKGGWGWQPGGEAENRLKLAVLFLMTYPGIPMIYYGAEIGMEGETDPGCRKPMVWEPAGQNLPLRQYVQQLTGLRRERTELQAGSFTVWVADESQNQAGFIRRNGNGEIAVLLHNNPCEAELELQLPPSFQGRRIRDLLTGQTWEAAASIQLQLAPYSGYLFVAETPAGV